MRWMWRQIEGVPDDGDEAGVEQAQAALDDAMAQWPAVRETAARSRWMARFQEAG